MDTHPFRPLRPVRCTNSYKEGLVPCSAHGADDAQRETEAVLEGLAAPLVGANVGEGGEEFVEEVAVSGVNL